MTTYRAIERRSGGELRYTHTGSTQNGERTYVQPHQNNLSTLFNMCFTDVRVDLIFSSALTDIISPN